MPDDLYFTEHHESHAASAFFPSPFESAAVLTFDGVGEWATSSIGVGEGNRITLQRQLFFPHSLGLLYSAFTYYCGFRVNSGEYKLMGLAPYGEPRYADRILDELIDLREDGSFRLDMRYFGFLGGTDDDQPRFDGCSAARRARPRAAITRREMDLARSIQAVTEEVVLRMARHAAATTGSATRAWPAAWRSTAWPTADCCARARSTHLDPARGGDAGGALGAALLAWHQITGHPRVATARPTA